MTISFLDTKLTSFYRHNDPITGDTGNEIVVDYDLYYDIDVKKKY